MKLSSPRDLLDPKKLPASSTFSPVKTLSKAVDCITLVGNNSKFVERKCGLLSFV